MRLPVQLVFRGGPVSPMLEQLIRHRAHGLDPWTPQLMSCHVVVVAPLFPAFGPEPVATRMALGGAAALVTTPSLHARKVRPARERVPTLRQVLLVDEGAAPMPAADGQAGLHDLDALLGEAVRAVVGLHTGYVPGPMLERELMARELGLPEGDLSTLEGVPS